MKYSAFTFLVLFLAIHWLACTKIKLQPNTFTTFTIESDSIVFAVIGDYGEAGGPAHHVSDMVKGWAPDFILTLGDNNYNSGGFKTIKKNVGAYYCDYIYNPDAPAGYRCNGQAAAEEQNRFFPTVGNHDFNGQEKNKPYRAYFSLPDKEIYYDFQWGPVHFFALNSGEYGESSCCQSEQSLWLQKKLDASDRPFKLVYFHHPPYSGSKHGSTWNMQWPFEAWGASTVMTGHEHNYQRITRRDNPRFPYLINGLGGKRKLYDCGVNPLDPEQFRTFCYNDNYGAIKGIATEKKLLLQFFAIDQPDLPIDEVVIRGK